MDKAMEALSHELSKIRTGRASTHLVDDIRVDYYGTLTPLNQVATLGVPEPRLLTISPWEVSLIPLIEKAISASDLGLTPSNDGKIIRIPIPALNEERRKELVKMIKKYGEEARVSLRHHRREGMDKLKGLEKSKELAEDEHKHLDKEVQKLTDDFVAKVDELCAHKEKEIMEV
jgi:ribosome recycling factor